MESFDVIVIGGGLLGSFALRSLARFKLKAALLEKREDLCTGISRANTAIVYSGIDNKPGSLKTTLCVKAARSFSGLCGQLGVRYRNCGSIMISFGERGDSIIHRKFEQGKKNGVRGMKMLSSKDVLALEPNISESVKAGLYVPDTGTVMPWELCLAAAENAAENGVEIHLNTEVSGIEAGELFHISTNKGDFRARAVINCAGLSADKLHRLAFAPTVRIEPTAGDYYVLDTKASGLIRHVIFHEPEEKGKGLTLVPTVEGNVLIGPTERSLSFDNQNSDGHFTVHTAQKQPRCLQPNEDFMPGFFDTSEDGLKLLRELAAQVVPKLPMRQIISQFGAVRPNPGLQTQDENGIWVPADRSVNDFCILESEQGTFISLVGIKTPGLTCSNELGRHVADKIAKKLGAKINRRFNPVRVPPVRASQLDDDAFGELIEKNPLYGNIICRCRGISEGEIVDAIRRMPGAVTTDGIKRRTGADSGRCQGGFCVQRTIEILARELGCRIEDVTKKGGASWICTQKTGI